MNGKAVAALMKWYDGNRRVLPWREDPAPYHVWISEIMLQQTRVEAVKPYYARFLEALPDIASLAAVSDDALMKLWQGLGYYSRARNLKRAAILIMEEHGGVMPADPEELLRLPGIGRYTAGAIASIAYGLRAPAVDGNALRIWTRIHADDRDISAERTKKEITAEIADILPEKPHAAGRFNQALMDLGSMVCLPNGEPACAACPLASCCAAHRAGREQDYPVTAKKKPRRIEKRTVFVIGDDTWILLRRRPDNGLLAGLYELPSVEGHLNVKEAKRFLAGLGIGAVRITPLPPAKHIFTHIEWRMTGYRIKVDEWASFFQADTGLIPAGKQDISTKYSIPSAFSNYMLYIG
ncbi:MAG: A/G-specific adenine glycosylase [Lachnospiraceae bacterium]|nr:A/G-specific adenine glycosylase [Lachnospiraceae bacterium]